MIEMMMNVDDDKENRRETWLDVSHDYIQIYGHVK